MNIDHLNHLLQTAHILDQHGQHHSADAITQQINLMATRTATIGPAMAHSLAPNRAAQNQQAMGLSQNPQLNVPNNRISILLSRIQNLRQTVSRLPSIPDELRQALLGQVSLMMNLLSYGAGVIANRSRKRLRLVCSGQANVSGVEQQLDEINNLAQEVLSGSNPQLLQQIQLMIKTCQHYLWQHLTGIQAGFSENLQAVQIQQSGSTLGIGSSKSPTDDLQTVARPSSTDDWYQQHGTTQRIFRARCQAWSNTHGIGIEKLSELLRQEAIPNEIVADILDHIESKPMSGIQGTG